MRSTDLGPTLETARLVLRPPVAEDFEPWCAFSGDAEASRFLGGVQTPPVVWRSVRYTAGSWALTGSASERATIAVSVRPAVVDPRRLLARGAIPIPRMVPHFFPWN